MNQIGKALGCLGTVIFSVVFIGAGVAIMVLVGKNTTFDCKRLEPPTNQGKCELASKSILPIASEETIIPIKDLIDAKLDISYDDEDNSETYRVLLLTNMEESIPLTFYYSGDRSDKQQQIQQIQTFLANTNQTDLNIQQDDRLFGYIFGGIFAGVGILTLISGVVLPPLRAMLGRR